MNNIFKKSHKTESDTASELFLDSINYFKPCKDGEAEIYTSDTMELIRSGGDISQERAIKTFAGWFVLGVYFFIEKNAALLFSKIDNKDVKHLIERTYKTRTGKILITK